MERSVELSSFILLGAALGALSAAAFGPAWVAAMTGSLAGVEVKAYWYLARAAGVVAYLLLWGAVVLGLMITSRVSRLWPGGPEAVTVHQFVSILALAMAAFHALILLGDRSMAYSGLELLVPFTSGRYRPWWVGLGQLGGYLAAVVVLSFYVRRVIGARAWRLIHYSSFALYLLVLAHGIGAGTDASAVPMIGLYALTGLIVYVLTVYRLLVLARSRRQMA